jgi:hypothetical protein
LNSLGTTTSFLINCYIIIISYILAIPYILSLI